MRIDELFNADNYKIEDFDLKDDLIFFMNSEPEFYRKSYYPTMCTFKEYHDKGKKINPLAFKKLVEKAYLEYSKEFPVEGLEKNISKEMCEEICTELHKIELENIKSGQYDIEK
jgi:hypothetical protein